MQRDLAVGQNPSIPSPPADQHPIGLSIAPRCSACVATRCRFAPGWEDARGAGAAKRVRFAEELEAPPCALPDPGRPSKPIVGRLKVCIQSTRAQMMQTPTAHAPKRATISSAPRPDGRGGASPRPLLQPWILMGGHLRAQNRQSPERALANEWRAVGGLGDCGDAPAAAPQRPAPRLRQAADASQRLPLPGHWRRTRWWSSPATSR